MGVIKHLAKFLAMLPELCRVSYLPLLHDILHSTNPFNWRLRQHLAHQLPALVLLPPKIDLYRTLFSTVMILLQDPVASVRRVTFEGVTALINNLCALADEEVAANGHDSELALTYRSHVDDVIAAINSFATGEKYQLRQLWCELCGQLLRDLPRPFFEENFIEGILILTLDTVTNVRIALSEFLSGWGDDVLPPWAEGTDSVAGDACSIDSKEVLAKKETSPWHWLLRRADIKHCIERLSRDDNDIYLNFTKLAPLYPDIKFSSMSCRGRKAPPGGLVSIPLDPSPMTINMDAIAASESLMNSSFISDDTVDVSTSGSGFEDLHSSRLLSASRDQDDRNRSCSSIDIPGQQRSRSNSINLNLHIAPIEIEKVTAAHPVSTCFTPPHLDKDHVPLSGGILADEVEMVDGFVPMPPPDEDEIYFPGSGKIGYDDDEDDEAGAVEEALINAAKAAAAQQGNNLEESHENNVMKQEDEDDSAEETRAAATSQDS